MTVFLVQKNPTAQILFEDFRTAMEKTRFVYPIPNLSTI